MVYRYTSKKGIYIPFPPKFRKISWAFLFLSLYLWNLNLDFNTVLKAYFTCSRSTFLTASTHQNFYKSYGFL